MRMRILFTLMTLVVGCAGCVSYPYIDDSIAKLDANPVDVATRFKLPEASSYPIAPQTADALVGDWGTELLRPVCHSVGIVSGHDIDNEIYNYDEKYMGVTQDYTFKTDGSFCHNEGLQESLTTSILIRLGTWSYNSGILTLHYKIQCDERSKGPPAYCLRRAWLAAKRAAKEAVSGY